VTWKSTFGPQAVNHLNQFTSVTPLFQSQARRGSGRLRLTISTKRPPRLCPQRCARVARRGATFSNNGHQPDDSDGPGRVCDVRDPRNPVRKLVHPLTVLSTLPTALVGGLLTLVFVWQKLRSTVCGHVHVDGDCEEERDHDRGLRSARVLMRRGSGASNSRREHGSLRPS